MIFLYYLFVERYYEQIQLCKYTLNYSVMQRYYKIILLCKYTLKLSSHANILQSKIIMLK